MARYDTDTRHWHDEHAIEGVERQAMSMHNGLASPLKRVPRSNRLNYCTVEIRRAAEQVGGAVPEMLAGEARRQHACCWRIRRVALFTHACLHRIGGMLTAAFSGFHACATCMNPVPLHASSPCPTCMISCAGPTYRWGTTHTSARMRRHIKHGQVGPSSSRTQRCSSQVHSYGGHGVWTRVNLHGAHGKWPLDGGVDV